MEFKKDFMLREIVGEAVLIPTGETAAHFLSMNWGNLFGRIMKRPRMKTSCWDSFWTSMKWKKMLQKLIWMSF